MIRLLSIAVCVIVAVLTMVALLGPAWHMLRGTTIFFAEWVLPVPEGFFVTNSSRGPNMWRVTLGTPFFSRPYGHVSLYRRPEVFSFDRDYGGFKDGITQASQAQGYGVVSEHVVVADGTSVYCRELQRRAPAPRSLMRCSVEGSNLVIFYEGDPSYLAGFATILQGMAHARVTNRS
jgi:hypothetical protein